jgi:hypothetical protein
VDERCELRVSRVSPNPDRATGRGDRRMWHAASLLALGNIRLTVGHLQVIRQVISKLRDHYLTGRRIPVLRQLCREVGAKRHRINALLQDPTATWRIAGLRYPGEEALAHLESDGVTVREIL